MGDYEEGEKTCDPVHRILLEKLFFNNKAVNNKPYA